MSKRFNTIVFILAASLFNVLVTLAVLILCFVVVAKAFPGLFASSSLGITVILTIFLLSLVISALAYRGVLVLIRKRIDMDKYFEPLFGGRKPRRPN